MELKIGILYIALHNQLVNKFGIEVIVPIKELFCILGKGNKIKKNCGYIAVKEMDELKLVKIIDRDHVKILPCSFDLNKVEDINKLYKLADIF